MIHLANPIWVWSVLLIPFGIYWEWKKPRAGLLYSDTTALQKALGKTSFRWIDALLLAIKVLAILLLIIALARPQLAHHEKELNRNGVDIIIALDASGSMAAEDLQGNRLTSAKKIMADFIQHRENDRIGFIVFGERAILRSPLTFDHNMLINLIDPVTIGMAGEGTAIGEALVAALNRIRKSTAKTKLVILVSDGENNSGAIDPATASKLACDIGIKIDTIGIGSAQGAPMPIQTPQGKVYAQMPDGTLALTKLHPEELIAIADTTGGQYFHAKSTDELKSIFATIDKLEKTKLKTIIHAQYDDLFSLAIFLALITIIAELIIKKSILKVYPS